jgi:hypothetical protein
MCKNDMHITEIFSGLASILIKPSQVSAPQSNGVARRMQVLEGFVPPRSQLTSRSGGYWPCYLFVPGCRWGLPV